MFYGRIVKDELSVSLCVVFVCLLPFVREYIHIYMCVPIPHTHTYMECTD